MASALTSAGGLLSLLGPSLRLVVVSDTHGFERHFADTVALPPWLLADQQQHLKTHSHTSSLKSTHPTLLPIHEQPMLPQGDVLLHLGDFAIDAKGRQRYDALNRFDAWLSAQPHKTKIVVRGNHDPHRCEFPLSKAMYFSKPASVVINGYSVSIIPYHSRGSGSQRVHSGDVVASHVPPRGILDQCISGERGGSRSLRYGVAAMVGGPPKLWVCGHIHEGRGAKRVRLGRPSEGETIVVNAANANPGRAMRLVRGPVVISLSGSQVDFGAGFDQMEGQILDEGQTFDHLLADASSMHAANTDMKGAREEPDSLDLLLAIDLGLCSGISLFSADGLLLRYEQFKFSDQTELFEVAPRLLKKWEMDFARVNLGHGSSPQNKSGKIAYVAIEGGDVPLWDAWKSAVVAMRPNGSSPPQLLSISPREWRSELLSKKERQSGFASKEASRLIARQVVEDYGIMGAHSGSFSTDVAESVLVGLHVARRLGWIRRNEAVRRYSNGHVVLPRKKVANS